MKKIIFLILSLLLIAGSYTCQEKIDIEADEQALIKATEEWDVNAITDNLKNLDQYTENAIRIDNGSIYEGKEAIGNLLRSYNEDYTVLSNKNTVENIWVSGDLATVRGSFLGSVILKESGDTLHSKGAWVGVSERQSDGSWKSVLSLGTEIND